MSTPGVGGFLHPAHSSAAIHAPIVADLLADAVGQELVEVDDNRVAIAIAGGRCGFFAGRVNDRDKCS